MSSSSSEMVYSGRFPGRRMFKSPEKSSFSQTCNLLSQYLKEKGSFGDLGLGMTFNHEGNGMPGTMSTTPATTMNLFPQHSEFGASVLKKEPSNKTDSISGNKSEPRTAQMTIFYGGQVMVFDDFPADKAKEIMLLAGRSSQSPTNISPSLAQKTVESTAVNPRNVVPSFSNNLIPEQVQRPPQPTVSDLPIARKVSLTRFLEKRKDRLTARAPYQTSDSSAAPSSPVGRKSSSWLGLVAPSQLQYQQQT